MSYVGFLWISLVQTLLRALPFPCKTGLIPIGNPGRDAPVLLTCNFQLTVERVKRALRGSDAYLLVANSRGINVWCAASGGHFTDHDVVSVIKTSGIEKLVNHRRIILPQLAATGVDSTVVQRKTGWSVVWGPVYAADLPVFLASGLQTTPETRTVRFPWTERLEMAAAWAFPMSLLALLAWPFWTSAVFSLVGLIWGLSLAIFLSFPLYQLRLRAVQGTSGFCLAYLRQASFPLLIWVLFTVAVVASARTGAAFSWVAIWHWSLSALVVVLLMSIELMGSTPVFKSGLHEERRLRVALDQSRCEGVALCQQVCPTDVFDIDDGRRLVILARLEQCVQCGACIVQCPVDALYFRSPTGAVVPAETVRRFKLNLLGSRSVGLHRSEHI